MDGISSTVGVLIVLGGARDFAGKLLEGLALGLGDEERSEDTEEHEESEDLEDVVQPGRSVSGSGAANTEGTNDDLSNDGTDLARGGRDTVRGGTVAGREALARNDEGGGVGTEVEEELAQNVETEFAARANDVVSEAEDAEEDGEESKAHDLDRLATDSVNKSDSDPVTRDGTSTDDDQVTDSVVVVDLVHVLTTGVTDSGKDDRVVERDTVESDIEEEP